MIRSYTIKKSLIFNFQSLVLFLPFISGILIALSFPITNLNLLIYFSLFLLFYGFLKIKATKIFHIFYGFIFTFTFYFIHCFWITAVARIGSIGVPALILLSIYQSLFYILFFYLLYLIKNKIINEQKIFFAYFIPFVWVAVEYLKSLGFMGFSWGTIAYSQYKFLSLIQIAEYTGVYGVSFLIIFLTFSFSIFVYNKINKFPILIAAIFFILNIFLGKVIINNNKFSNLKNKLNIAIIQVPESKDINWTLQTREKLFNEYFNLSLKAKDTDIIIWPETVFAIGHLSDGELNNKFSLVAKKLNKIFIVGAFDEVNNQSYNTAAVFSKDGFILGKYYKQQLVPFGEKVPFKNLFIKFGYNPWGEGSTDLTAGKVILPIVTPLAKIGFNICYETTFTYISRLMALKGAEFMVALVADSWFPKSTTYQHNSMFVFRAVENRKYLVRSADVGISDFIDSTGNIYKQMNPTKPSILIDKIYKNNKLTFYTKYGDVFAKICVLATLMLMILFANDYYKNQKGRGVKINKQ